MATFNGVYESLIGNINSFVDTYDDQYLNMLEQMDLLIPEVKKYGINSTSTERLHNIYNDFTSNINNNINNINSYYDNLLQQANSNASFTSLLNEQGVETTPAFRKEIAAKRMEYINKIESERQAAQQYFSNIRKDAKSKFIETGYSPKRVNRIVGEKNRFINNEIMPEINSLNEISNALNGKIDLGTQEINSMGEEYLKRIQNPDITQNELKQAIKDFGKWSKDYQRGYAGDVSSDIASDINTANEKITALKEKLKSTNYNTEEAQNLFDNIVKDIDGGIAKLYGDGGAMSNTAMSVNEQRLNAMHRISGNGQIPDMTSVVDEVSTTSPTPNLTTRSRPTELVKGSRAHRLEGTPIKNSTAPNYLIREKNDDLIINLTRKANQQISPSDYLTAKRPERFEIKNPKVLKEAGEEVADNFSAKRLLKKHGLNSVINIGATIIDYKESRREGQGVLKSAAKAGINFAIGETLGLAAIPFYLASSAPVMATKAIEGVNKMEREMNSVARMQPFSDTYFQDTQQIATMRQSGMEMAKMAQYNLQQTLMGAEATHLHR